MIVSVWVYLQYQLNQLLWRKFVASNSWAVSQDLLKYYGQIPQLKVKNCYRVASKDAWKTRDVSKMFSAHAREHAETFTVTCSKSHRRSEPEELPWLPNKALSCPEHVTEKRHPLNSEHTLSNTVLKPCTVVRSAPPWTRCMSVFTSRRREECTRSSRSQCVKTNFEEQRSSFHVSKKPARFLSMLRDSQLS